LPDANQHSQRPRSGRSSMTSGIRSLVRERKKSTTNDLHIQQKYTPEHLNEVGYIKATWLNPFKEKLVRA
jgi:hypothetical protein